MVVVVGGICSHCLATCVRLKEFMLDPAQVPWESAGDQLNLGGSAVGF